MNANKEGKIKAKDKIHQVNKLFMCLLVFSFVSLTSFSKEKAWRVRDGVEKSFKDFKNSIWEAG